MKTNTSPCNLVLEAKMKALDTGLDPQRADALLEELLRSISTCGHLLCTVVDHRNLRVQSQEAILCEVPIHLANSKLRSLCARLAVRCRDWLDRDVSLYGDDVEFVYPETNQRCRVYFENKPGAQRLEMAAVSAEKVDSHSMDGKGNEKGEFPVRQS
jgi:hypothetical protein